MCTHRRRGEQSLASTNVRIWSGSWASPSPGCPAPAALAARLETPVEESPYLDEGTLLKTRSRKVCMSCHWYRHLAGVNCIPVLTCQLQQGWAPEVA